MADWKDIHIAELEAKLASSPTAADRDKDAEIARLRKAVRLARKALMFPAGKVMRPEAEARQTAFDAIDAALTKGQVDAG